MKWEGISRNGKVHLIKKGRYACNGAIGIIPPRHRLTENDPQRDNPKCKNCLRKVAI